jgi:hypothetical protein
MKTLKSQEVRERARFKPQGPRIEDALIAILISPTGFGRSPLNGSQLSL